MQHRSRSVLPSLALLALLAALAPFAHAQDPPPPQNPPPEPDAPVPETAPDVPQEDRDVPQGPKPPQIPPKLLRRGPSAPPVPPPAGGRRPLTPGAGDDGAHSLRGWEIWWELNRDRFVPNRARDHSIAVAKVPPDPRTSVQAEGERVGSFERIEPSLRLVLDHEKSDIVLARERDQRASARTRASKARARPTRRSCRTSIATTSSSRKRRSRRSASSARRKRCSCSSR
jgi:hypothetical protein